MNGIEYTVSLFDDFFSDLVLDARPSPTDISLTERINDTLTKTEVILSEFFNTVKTTFRKDFGSKESYMRELFWFDHYNHFTKLLNPDKKRIKIYSHGYDKETGKFFIEMDKIGGGEDLLKKIIDEKSPEKLFKYFESAVDELALLHVIAPESQNSNGDGARKLREGTGRFFNILDSDGISYDKNVLDTGIENILDKYVSKDKTAYLDGFLRNFIVDNDNEIFKIDWNKSEYCFGGAMMDLNHILYGTDKLSKQQQDALFSRYVSKFNKTVGKYNSMVKEKLANAKSTMLELVETYFVDGQEKNTVLEEIKNSKYNDIKNYMNLVRKFENAGNKDAVYMVENFVSNLKDRKAITEEDTLAEFHSIGITRCMASYAAFGKWRQEEKDPLKRKELLKQQKALLENAIKSANYLMDYNANKGIFDGKLMDMIDELESVYKKQFEPQPVINQSMLGLRDPNIKLYQFMNRLKRTA